MGPVTTAEADSHESPVLDVVVEHGDVRRRIETPCLCICRCRETFSAQLCHDATGDQCVSANTVGGIAAKNIEAQDLAAHVRCVHAVDKGVTIEVDRLHLAGNRTRHAR